MIKNIKPVIKKVCILIVCTLLLTLSAVVIAGSAVQKDDTKYSANIVDEQGEVLDIIPVGIGIKGDANVDEKVNVRDAALIANYLANIGVNSNYMPEFKNSLGSAMADANEDGRMTVRDAAAIAQYLANKIENPDVVL